MAREAFEAIAAGLEDAIAYAKGDATRGVAGQYPVGDLDSKALDRAVELSQAEPVKALGVTEATAAAWKPAVAYWIYRDTAGRWRWGLYAVDNKRLADSAEGYPSKADCLAAISLVKGSASVPVFERSAA